MQHESFVALITATITLQNRRTVGCRKVASHRYLMLEDLAGRYAHPCVLDAKVGVRTWYAWAPQKLIDKYRCVRWLQGVGCAFVDR